jgi:RNA polymerase-binding protein DksA
MHKAIVRRVVAATEAARKSAKAVLMTDRTLPPPVEIEPRLIYNPTLRALRKERLRLLNEIKHQEFMAQEKSSTGNHLADVASDVTEQVTTLALRRHLESLLVEVERAIVRAEKGTYGLCERCGKPISEERLQAMPSATLCIECAQLQRRPR